MFYTFTQNNSGGYFKGPEYVIVEADSASEANYIALNHTDSPIYFNGCRTGNDCSCCGDRWSAVWEDCGTCTPEIYGDADIESYGSRVLVFRKQIKISNIQREKIIDVLAKSNIVWTRYDLELLTEKILTALTSRLPD
jgi:hypothetical protein